MANSLSEVYGEPLRGPFPTLWERFNTAVDEYPNNVALVSTHQKQDLFGIPSKPLEDVEYQQNPYLRWTFKELKSGIDRATRGFEELGVHIDMPVLTFLSNGAELVLTLWATSAMGGVYVPINPRNLANKDEVSHMIKVAMSACPGQRPAIVALDQNIANQIDLLPISEGAIKIILEDQGSGKWIPFRSLMASAQIQHLGNGVSVPAKHFPTNDAIFFTSGTTSLPKGCKTPGKRLTSTLKSLSVSREWVAAGDRWAIVVPNNHAMGYIALLATLVAGAAVVFPGATVFLTNKPSMGDGY
jgi:acyl-CoA synthetase (AMP-forming)/AMP-acid ligase II